MNKRKFYSGVKEAVEILQQYAPYRTGNLANNAIKCRFSTKQCAIYVDRAIAPYMPFTDKPWFNRWSKKTNGQRIKLKNPNEGWFGRTTEIIYFFLVKYYEDYDFNQQLKKYKESHK